MTMDKNIKWSPGVKDLLINYLLDLRDKVEKSTGCKINMAIDLCFFSDNYW